MFHYSPQYEPPSERVLLIQTTKSAYSPEYGSVTAKVIRRAMKDDTAADPPHYFDGVGATGFRHATWSGWSSSALFVEDLVVHAQFDVQKDDKPYGEKLAFQDMVRVEHREAELMFKTFKALDKKLAQQQESYGYVRDVADLILRTANALGIRTFAEFKPGQTSLDSALRTFDASNVVYTIEQQLKKARE